MNIYELISDSLEETRILMAETPPRETYESMSKLVDITLASDKTKLFGLSNYDIMLPVLDYYNYQNVSRQTTIKFLNEVKHRINSWTFADIPTLNSICNPDNQDPQLVLKAIYKLGLNSNFTSYELRPAFRLLCNILLFKHNLENTTIKRFDRLLLIKAYKETDLEVFVGLFKEELSSYDYNQREEYLTNRMKVTLDLQHHLDEDLIDESFTMPPEWHRYLDPKVLTELYNILFDFQHKKHDALLATNQELQSTINRTPLIKYLYDNKINPKSIPGIKELNNIDFNLLIKRIEFLKSLGFNLYEIITELQSQLLSISDEQINTFTYFISKDILKKSTLANNINLLSRVNHIKVNYEILKSIIDFNNPYYSDSILLLDSHQLRHRISILKEYDLSTNNLNYLLCNFAYLNIYDLLIENDLPLHLFPLICQTKEPTTTIKKIILCKEINEPFETSRHLLRKEVSEPDSFFILDELVDQYVSRTLVKSPITFSDIDSITTQKEVLALEKYRDKDLYVFNGTKISRPKVLKYLQTIYNQKEPISGYLYTAIISSSLLTDTDLYNVNYCLNQLFMLKYNI